MSSSNSVENSILSLIVDPEIRLVAAQYLESWQFSDSWRFAFVSCIRKPDYMGAVPNLNEFIIDLHNNFSASEEDCELAAQILMEHQSPKSHDVAVQHIQEWVKTAFITNGIEIIAAGNDKNFKQKGIESIKTAVTFQIAMDSFYDFSDLKSIQKAKEEDFPDGTHVILSSFSVLNKALSYGGLKFGDLVAVAGACHGPDEGILMYDGTVRMSQDVRVGDQLMGDDSTPRNVLSLAQGCEDMYRVTTFKQESFVVNASHILHLNRIVQKETGHRKNEYVYERETLNIRLRDFLDKPQYYQRNSRLVKPEIDVLYEVREHVLSPYFLGLLIGDGNYSTPTKVRFYASDSLITEYVESYVVSLGLKFSKEQVDKCTHYYFQSYTPGSPNLIMRELARLGMTGGKARTKFIPAEYTLDSVEHRLQLLAGLLDSDGYYDRVKNNYHFTSVSEALALQVKSLCLGLGLAVGYHIDQNKTGKSAHLNDSFSHCLTITGDLARVPCRVSYKQGRNREEHNKNVHLHGIKSVELLGKGDYYGWEVDGNHLYLDDDFFIQHNTGVGKSTVIVTEGAFHAQNGYMVCHIVIGDLTEFDIFIKYLSNYTGIDTKEIIAGGYEQYLTDEIKEYFSNVRVKALSPDCYDVYQLLAKAEQLYQKFPFQVLMIDYDANIRDSSNAGNSYLEGGVVYANLKGYSKGKCVTYVGSQTKLPHWGEELVQKTFMNDSSKKQHHLDVMIGVGKNKEYNQVGIFNLPKIRRGVSDMYSFVHFDNARSRVYEIRKDRYEQMIHAYKLVKEGTLEYSMAQGGVE